MDRLLASRRRAASHYAAAFDGCSWAAPQHVPAGWAHDYWCYAVALDSPEIWQPFTEAVVRHGGERPYGAWRLTYQEPAFRHLAEDGCCPVAEDLQPRLVQMQTNNLAKSANNANAVHLAVQELGG
jgi:perosamine synthetase